VNRFLLALSPWSANAITITEQPLTIVTHIAVPERGGKKPHLTSPPLLHPTVSAAGDVGAGMRRERRLSRAPRRARRDELGNGPRRRGRIRRLFLALPLQLRETVLGDPSPGWILVSYAL
jgi:hypothetical protein